MGYGVFRMARRMAGLDHSGAVDPAGLPGASQYIYTDSTGAEYHLNQNSGNIWSSQESIYVWFDANANILHFSGRQLLELRLHTPAGGEPDSGVMYPHR